MATAHERGDVRASQEQNDFVFSFSKPGRKKMGPNLPFEGHTDHPVEWQWNDQAGMWHPRKICRYESYTLKGEVLLPKYQFVESNKLLDEIPRNAKYEEVCFGNGEPCNNPEQWSSLNDWKPPGDNTFPALHMDFYKEYHVQNHLTYWGTMQVKPFIGYWIQMQRARCQEEFHKYARQHTGIHALPGGYETIYDSNLRHPGSRAVYSVLRTHRELPLKLRKKEMVHHFEEIYTSQIMHLDFLMRLNQTTIAIEVTPVAQSILGRIRHGIYLCTYCKIFAGLTFCMANSQRRHPGLYLLPAVLTFVCAYQYSVNYSKNDPTAMYRNWISWHQNPRFLIKDFGIKPHLFRQEIMCILLRESLVTQKKYSNIEYCGFVTFIVGKAFYDRMKIGNLAFARKWEILEPYIAPKKLYSFLHTTYSSPTASAIRFEFSRPSRPASIIPKICIACGLTGIGICVVSFLVKKYMSVFSPKTRTKITLGECIVRGVKGERRYSRLGEVLYWVFRKRYPHDDMYGQLDEYYLTRYKYEETERLGSWQFYL